MGGPDFFLEDALGEILHQRDHLWVRQQAAHQVVRFREKVLVDGCGIQREAFELEFRLGKDIGGGQLLGDRTARQDGKKNGESRQNARMNKSLRRNHCSHIIVIEKRMRRDGLGKSARNILKFLNSIADNADYGK